MRKANYLYVYRITLQIQKHIECIKGLNLLIDSILKKDKRKQLSVLAQIDSSICYCVDSSLSEEEVTIGLNKQIEYNKRALISKLKSLEYWGLDIESFVNEIRDDNIKIEL